MSYSHINEHEISAGLVEELLKLDRPGRRAALCSLAASSLTRSHGTRRGWSRMGSVGTFRAKEKITAKPQQVVDWTFAEKARR